MDFPEAVSALVVMDGVSIYETLERANWQFAKDWWHWFFFAQSDKAEAAILADPDLWYPCGRTVLGPENAADYLAATRNPEVVRGMLADYRAGLEIDYEMDKADRLAGCKVQCPVAVFWSAHDDMERLYGDPTEPWTAWTKRPVSGHRIMSGHHMAEEAPDEVADTLLLFLRGRLPWACPLPRFAPSRTTESSAHAHTVNARLFTAAPGRRTGGALSSMSVRLSLSPAAHT